MSDALFDMITPKSHKPLTLWISLVSNIVICMYSLCNEHEIFSVLNSILF